MKTITRRTRRYMQRRIVSGFWMFSIVLMILTGREIYSESVNENTKDDKIQAATSTTSSDDDATCTTTDDGNGQECKNPMADENNHDETINQNGINNNSVDTQPAEIRMITHEELAKHTGENEGTDIWLSVLGEVYNVTDGRSYYGPGSSYSAFAGVDCSLCFMSGAFTKEEAMKDTSEISNAHLPGILDWRNFYAGHATYKFVGYLIDPRFYDENGKATPKMLELRDRMKIALEEAEQRKIENAKKREEKLRLKAEKETREAEGEKHTQKNKE